MRKEPEFIEVKDPVRDPKDYCQYNSPMTFCKECGTYMHCKHEKDTEFKRRPE